MELRRNPNVTLRQLWHFVVAAETGTMSEAARRLHMAPSAISMSIAELERVIGAQLCVKRKSKGITLTPAGHAAFLQARQVLDMVGEMVYVSQGDMSRIRGPLSVGCYAPIAPRVIPRMLEEFGKRYPLVDVQFVEGYHEDLQTQVLEGALDLAFLFDVDLMPSTVSMPLIREHPRLLVAEAHPFASRESVRVSELGDENLLFFNAVPLFGRVMDMFRSEGIEPVIRHQTRSYATVRSLVGRGMGVALVYDTPTLDRSYEGRRVLAIPVESERDYAAEIAIVRSRSIRLHSRARAWMETARDQFATPEAGTLSVPPPASA